MKHTLGAIAVVASLAFASDVAPTPAFAASADRAASVKRDLVTSHAANATDVSARRRHWRRYRHVQPFPYVYPPTYGYYRPRPVVYPYSYSYYRPRPYFYRPYYAPPPLFSVGFGPRYYW